MPYQYPEIKKFLGLFLQKNSFTVPEGAMETALNIIINDDDVINKVRGRYKYFTPNSGTLNNLFLYEQKLLAIFNNKISYFTDTGSAPNITGTESVLSGETVLVTAPRKSRSTQESGNLYFTTENGVLKLDAYNSKIYPTGAPSALDLTATFDSANGIFPGDSSVAYRILFGRRDANDNLILGAPSDTLVLSNVKQEGVTWSRTTNVVTVSFGVGHNIVTGMTIEVTASTGATPVAAGNYLITGYTATTFTFAETAANSSGDLDYIVARQPILEFSVPTQISTTADNYFYQIYRTSFTSSANVSPVPDFRLVEEILLTSAQITSGTVFYTDFVEDTLVSSAAELYTNPNSQEGELQANSQPPKCQDLTEFKNYVIYSNCITRHLLTISVVAPGDLASGDFVETKVDATTRRYVARTGVGNSTVTSDSGSIAGTTVTVNYLAHGFSTGYTIFVSNAKGTGTLPSGFYTLTGATANSFTFVVSVAPLTLTSLDFQGDTDGTNSIFQLDNTNSSVAAQLRNTAKGLVKAINRDASSLIYARYTSALTDTPGQILLSAKGFTGQIFLRANTTTAGGAFAPPLPNSFAAGTQVFSRNDQRPNSSFFSKLSEPEAVPLANEFLAGPKNEAILRVFALRDSVIYITEGGIYRGTGDGPFNFTVTALDTTIKPIAGDSAYLLNNQVFVLSNQGVCAVSESSVQILSRKVENIFEPIVGSPNISTATCAVAYESDRSYRISTLEPNVDTKNKTFLYNVLNDTWTESDKLFDAAIVGPSDTMFSTTGNVIYKERKNGNRLDYCDQNFSVTVASVSADKLSATISSPSTVPAIGDIIVKNNVFSRIKSVAGSSPTYTVEFYRQTNLVAADAPQIYKAYTSIVKMSPFHAGAVGRAKQFAQLQLHTRSAQITRLRILFTGPVFGGSEEVSWTIGEVGSITQGGWGEIPWGFFPWGLEDGINTIYKTEPAPIIRIYVPRFQQRSTYIQAYFEHSDAGETMDIQALSWAVRGYGERVTK